jgi:hypothetical protein
MNTGVKDKPESSTDTGNDLWLQGLKDKYGNHPDAKLQRGESPGNIRSNQQGNPQNEGSKSPSSFGKKAGNVLNAAGMANQVARDPKLAAKNAAKNLAGKAKDQLINKGLDKAGQALAAETGGLSIVAAQLLKNKKIRKFVMWLVILNILLTLAFIIIPIVIIVVVVGGGYTVTKQNQDNNTNNSQNTLKLTVDKTGPANVANGTNIQYTISYAFPLSAQNLSITDTLPDNATYVSSPAKVTYDAASHLLTWKLSDNMPAPNGGLYTSANLTGSFTFTVKPNNNDSYVVNPKAHGEVTGASGGSSSGTPVNAADNVPPSNNTCNGTYTFTSPEKTNFGDPNCTFTKDKLLNVLVGLDPTWATQWNTNIAACESSYNPNAYNGNSTSGTGAYGLFQMNKNNPGSDAGFVNWPIQAKNAVDRSNLIQSSPQLLYDGTSKNVLKAPGRKFCYWDCAKKLWPQNMVTKQYLCDPKVPLTQSDIQNQNTVTP